MYYVYLHQDKSTGDILYCGKGQKNRYRGLESRSSEHISLIKNGRIRYVILKRFENEDAAYVYEELITEMFKVIGQCKFNVYNGRRCDPVTKKKLSKILKGKKRTETTKKLISKNHSRHNAKKVYMYRNGKYIRCFESSREAGDFASLNGIASKGWVGRSLSTGELTKSTKLFPTGGYLFTYKDDRILINKSSMN